MAGVDIAAFYVSNTTGGHRIKRSNRQCIHGSETATERQCHTATRSFQLVTAKAVGQVLVILLVGQVAQLQVKSAGFQAGNTAKAVTQVDVGSNKTGGLVFGAVAELLGNAGLFGHRT